MLCNVDELKVREIEQSLKDWFIKRRFLMERAYAIKERLNRYNMTGLGGSAPQTASHREAVMWQDLSVGTPNVPTSLSHNAQRMKAQLYLDMFKTSTTSQHPCRNSGLLYLRCLKKGIADGLPDTEKHCATLFKEFSMCRCSLLAQQKKNLLDALVEQKTEDSHAASLWHKRDKLLKRLASQNILSRPTVTNVVQEELVK